MVWIVYLEWHGHSHGRRTPASITNPEHCRGAVAVYRKEVSSMSLCPPAHHADIMPVARRIGFAVEILFPRREGPGGADRRGPGQVGVPRFSCRISTFSFQKARHFQEAKAAGSVTAACFRAAPEAPFSRTAF